jgi:hypothetical protein
VTFTQRYFQALDDGAPIDAEQWCTPDFRFCVMWGVGDEAKQIAGDLAAFRVYLDSRVPPEGHVHHILYEAGDTTREVSFGRTTQQGEPLATFAFAVDLDGEGRRMRQLFAARTTTLAIGDLSGQQRPGNQGSRASPESHSDSQLWRGLH